MQLGLSKIAVLPGPVSDAAQHDLTPQVRSSCRYNESRDAVERFCDLSGCKLVDQPGNTRRRYAPGLTRTTHGRPSSAASQSILLAPSVLVLQIAAMTNFLHMFTRADRA